MSKIAIPETVHCDCGAEAQSWGFRGNVKYGRCQECEAKQEARQQELDARRKLRASRKQYVENCHECLNLVLPKRYTQCRMCLLSPKLQRTMTTAAARQRGLFLYGPPGIGKTFALCCFARYWIVKKQHCARITYDELCLEVRSTYKQDSSASELKILDRYTWPDVLFVEDIGTTVASGQQESNFSLRLLSVLLDRRWEQCLLTYVTSNKSLEEIGKSFDARIASRLKGLCEVVPVNGKDKR